MEYGPTSVSPNRRWKFESFVSFCCAKIAHGAMLGRPMDWRRGGALDLRSAPECVAAPNTCVKSGREESLRVSCSFPGRLEARRRPTRR